MGGFEQLFSPGRGEFEQKFSKNSNARGVARGDVEASIRLVHKGHDREPAVLVFVLLLLFF